VKDEEMALKFAMCAVGLRGQLGLNGRRPWEGNKGWEFQADVARFFDLTRGHVLIAGPVTVASIPPLAYRHRTIVEIRSHMDPKNVLDQFPERVVYIGGGPPVWSYALVDHWDITRLPYDGEADTWFDPAWLVAGGTSRPKLRIEVKSSANSRMQLRSLLWRAARSLCTIMCITG
jgi:dihydromethanopterin reductase